MIHRCKMCGKLPPEEFVCTQADGHTNCYRLAVGDSTIYFCGPYCVKKYKENEL